MLIKKGIWGFTFTTGRGIIVLRQRGGHKTPAPISKANNKRCGFSSFGRAPPCQGGGSEFDPRKPLHMVPWPSGKAKVCKTFIHQFKSGRHLQKIPIAKAIGISFCTDSGGPAETVDRYACEIYHYSIKCNCVPYNKGWGIQTAN